MTNLSKNWEKIVLAALIVVFLAELALLGQKSDSGSSLSVRKAKLRHRQEGGAKNISRKIENAVADLDARLAKLFTGKGDRDIFSAVKTSLEETTAARYAVGAGEAKLEVLDIKNKPLPIEYRGYIVFGDGHLVAQVNVHQKSYLVGTGAEFAGYKILNITSKRIVLLNGDSRRLTLGFRQISYSKDLMAVLRDDNSGQTIDIYKDSSFSGFKVLDITEDYVLVSKQGQHLKLWKGRVQ